MQPGDAPKLSSCAVIYLLNMIIGGKYRPEALVQQAIVVLLARCLIFLVFFWIVRIRSSLH